MSETGIVFTRVINISIRTQHTIQYTHILRVKCKNSEYLQLFNYRQKPFLELIGLTLKCT